MKSTPKTAEARILFAEDDDDFYYITKYALEEAGFTGKLDLVNNYRELMTYLEEKEKPALIILDLNTAPENWRATLQDVKTHHRHKDIPVVILTASEDPEDIAICGRYGRCTFFQKPSTFADWRACMDNILRMHAASK